MSKAKASEVRGKMGGKSGPEIAEAIFKEKWMLDQEPMLYENHDIENQEEANEVAKAQLEAKALDFITAQGSIIGTPSLKARSVIKLTGLGQRFSGPYYVTSVTHTIDSSGYRTDFQVKRNAR